jgi:hypothetical protein
MDKQRLHDALERLRAEIDRQEDLDDPTSQRLGTLAEDVAALHRGDQSGAPPRSVVQRFEQEIARLEAAHPSLTVTMTEIVEILTAAGI